MKLSAIALLLLAVTCPSGDFSSGLFILNQPFELRIGGTLASETDSLTISFAGVVTDSRCPLDVVCIVAGYAEIDLEVSTIDDREAVVTLSTYWTWGQKHTIDTLGYRITLLEVTPYPAHHDRPIPPEDYVVRLHVVPSWREESINIVSTEMVTFFRNHRLDGGWILAADIEGDSLEIRVQYGGGCHKHDFYLLGSCAWVDVDPPRMRAVLLNDGHDDTCKAMPVTTRKFDMSPLRSCGAVSGLLMITFPGDTASVTFAL